MKREHSEEPVLQKEAAPMFQRDYLPKFNTAGPLDEEVFRVAVGTRNPDDFEGRRFRFVDNKPRVEGKEKDRFVRQVGTRPAQTWKIRKVGKSFIEFTDDSLRHLSTVGFDNTSAEVHQVLLCDLGQFIRYHKGVFLVVQSF